MRALCFAVGEPGQAGGIVADRRGFIPVYERLKTNVPGIYVRGDVKGGRLVPHPHSSTNNWAGWG